MDIEPINVDLNDYNIIVKHKDYTSILEKLKEYENAFKNERKITLQIKGLDRSWEFLSYWEAEKYNIITDFGDDVPESLRILCKKIFSEELEELNNKIKQFIQIKGEIEVLQKQIKSKE